MTATPATLINGAATPTDAPSGHHHHQAHVHGTGRRIKNLLRPDGTKVHIAGNPDEARRMSQTLRLDEKDNFDLVIHGSPEHVSPSDPSRLKITNQQGPRLKPSVTHTPITKNDTASSRRCIQNSLPSSSMFFAKLMLFRQSFI